MKIEKKDPPATAPSPMDSISMAVTRHDMFANRQITQDMQFIAPCFVRWDIAPFQKVGNSSPVNVYILCPWILRLRLQAYGIWLPCRFGLYFQKHIGAHASRCCH